MKPSTEKKRRVIRCEDCGDMSVEVDASTWEKELRRVGWTVSWLDDNKPKVRCLDCRFTALENRLRLVDGYLSEREY